MTDETPAPENIPWYQAKIIRRLALGIVIQLVAVLHLSKYVAGVDLAALTDDLLELVAILYDLWAIHARATKPTPAITLTQAKADAANAIAQKSTTEKVP